MSASAAEIHPKTEVKNYAKPLEVSVSTALSPEQELMFECSRAELKDKNLSRIRELLQQPFDLEKFIGAAHRNGVMPLVCSNLLRKLPGFLPDETRRKIAGTFQKHTQRNLFLTFKLLEIVKILESEAIAVLPVKGPTLAAQIYGDPAMREFIDLDILVQPKDFDEAIKILTRNNYEIVTPVHWLMRRIPIINAKKDVGLRNAAEKVLVEMHWKLSGSHFSLPLEIESLWNRLEKIKVGGTALNRLSFQDLFIYLCLHGSRHGWERLGWICDLHEIILAEESAGKAIDWNSISHSAKNCGCEKVVELGLFLVSDFFKLKTDYPHWEQIENDAALKKIAVQVREKIFSEDRTTTEIGNWYLYHLALKERRTDRIKLHLHYFVWYFRLALKPKSLDKEIFHLPAAFYPLYFVLRPLRLIYNRVRF